MLVVIFETAGNVSHLVRADVWYGDGTFSVCPNLFYQLYTIHAAVHGKLFLWCSICCLQNLKDATHTFIWLQLKELMIQRGVSPNLKGFRSDLEPAPIKTLLAIFAPDSLSTCFFHLAQAHWRKIKSLGLMELYIYSEELSLLLRSFTALASVPEGSD